MPPRLRVLLSALLVSAVAVLFSGAAMAEPQRIVSVGGDVTEIIFALGEGDKLAAIDTTSTYPPADTEPLPKVGYMRQLSAEGVLSLRPDLLLLSEGAGPPETLAQLRASGVPMVNVPSGYTVAAVEQKIDIVAQALGEEATAQSLIADMRDQTAQAMGLVRSVAEAHGTEVPGVLFILSPGAGNALGAGQRTAADAIIRLAGGRNVFSDHDGYKPLSLEAVVAAAPDHLVMMPHTFAEIGGFEGLRQHPALSLTPAVTEGNVHVVDGNLLLSFGPRTPQAMMVLARALHPDVPGQ